MVLDGVISNPEGEITGCSSIDTVMASTRREPGLLGRAEASAVRSISTGNVALVPSKLS